jgi:XTP/dITP diphosphohydrolase
MRLVLASNNAKKLVELQALFSPLGLELVTQEASGLPRPRSLSSPSSRTR